jgi:hypothetical protein
MKTKIARLSAMLITAAALAPAAFAGPKYTPRFSNGASPQNPTADCCVVRHECKTDVCCKTKKVSSAPLGRAGQTYTKKVRDCKTICPVASENKRAVCKKGDRV